MLYIVLVSVVINEEETLIYSIDTRSATTTTTTTTMTSTSTSAS